MARAVKCKCYGLVVPTTNLRDVASSFIGRDEDLTAIAKRLEDGRLVTILGPGGMGKTRLAIRFAEQRVAAFSAHRGGGVWFCDLSDAQSAEDIAAVVAAAVNVKLEGLDADAAVSDALGLAIARRGRILFVLDNFDRLIEHAPTTVAVWLRAAPSSRFLVTSRAALDLVGEQTWSLSPLSREEAVELFVRRATEVQPRFAPTSSRDLVADIVDAVDRMPLAIELAATRMSVLTPAQLRQRLSRPRTGFGEPLDLLAGRREVSRHASMRRAVLDSVELLAPEAQRLFASCAVLRNGFTIEAAEHVIGDVVAPRERILDGLEMLARNSLLRVDVEVDEVARYALFEMIRDVAAELLATDDSQLELRGRHATYFASLCAPDASLAMVARELDNLLSAQQAATTLAKQHHSESRAHETVAIALAVEPLLSARGQSRLLVRLFDDALAALDASPRRDDFARVDLLLARGLARRELGESLLAKADFERGLDLAREGHLPALAATALTRLGEMSDVAGDTGAARIRFVEALELLDGAPESRARTLKEAEAYLRLGHAHRREGDLNDARKAVALSVGRYRELEHGEGIALATYELAVIEMFAGSHETAFGHFDEGLRTARHHDARVATGALLTARGCLLQDVGRLDEALDHHAEAARIFHDAGSRYREASTLYYLATSYLERGEHEEAMSILRRARAALAGVGAARYEVLISGCMASALAAAGRMAEADEAMAVAERAVRAVRNEPALACNVRLHGLALKLRKHPEREPEAMISEAEALVRDCPSDDSRFALRVLQGVRRTEPKHDDDNALVVWSDGGAFRLARETKVVTLPERSPLRRILQTFAERRIEAPGDAVSIDDVIRAGWPSEKIGADAAANRAHVALASLRKLGLRDVLVHGGGGYLLSQAVIVRLIKAD